MSKSRVTYVCSQCGATAAAWMGRCARCGEWNTMEQAKQPASVEAAAGLRTTGARPQPLRDVSAESEPRLGLGSTELERVLGGGLVPGSVVLLAGEPGIGKSTLLLQMATHMAGEGSVLYVSGEESPRQVGLRARRLGDVPENLLVLAPQGVKAVVDEVLSVSPPHRLVVVDSIQALRLEERGGAAGSVVQVRDGAAALSRAAKETDTAMVLIGHVTKAGAIAGPRVLEHMVDTVLYMEGDRNHAHRILRAVKNRFGNTNEVGVFEMTGQGLREVLDPSEVFLAERLVGAPGTAVAVSMQGTRPLLVEVQALTTRALPERVRRTATGFDFRRLLMLCAVLTKRAGIRLGHQDVLVNVVGGMTLAEPAADLAVALAIASASTDRPLAADVAVIGEVGLTGEVRSVAQLDRRVEEAARLGFRLCLVPRSYGRRPGSMSTMELAPVRSLSEAIQVLGLGVARDG